LTGRGAIKQRRDCRRYRSRTSYRDKAQRSAGMSGEASGVLARGRRPMRPNRQRYLVPQQHTTTISCLPRLAVSLRSRAPVASTLGLSLANLAVKHCRRTATGCRKKTARLSRMCHLGDVSHLWAAPSSVGSRGLSQSERSSLTLPGALTAGARLRAAQPLTPMLLPRNS
jgi:hypothetical protein